MNISQLQPETSMGRSRFLSRPLRLPWVLSFVGLYGFAIPWVYFNIVLRYLVNHDWNAVLPGLGLSALHRISMGGHMFLGAVAMIFGPIQFISSSFPRDETFSNTWSDSTTPLQPTHGTVRNFIHRWCGRVYIVCALTCSLFGLLFIALSKKMVGGWNMTLAFVVSGLVFGGCAYMALVTARAKCWTAHRNWSIRSFSQVLAPMLYRYWYVIMDVMGWYQAPGLIEENHCDLTVSEGGLGICYEYLRPFDMLHVWTYWISALIFAECIVRAFSWRDHHSQRKISALIPDTPILSNDQEETSTLMEENKRISVENTDTNNSRHSDSSNDPNPRMPTQINSWLLNAVGISWALVTITVTAKMFISA